MEETAWKASGELSALLAKERIATVLLVMPEGPLVRSIYPPGATEAVMARLQGLSRDHGLTLIQAREWFGEGEFLDSYHLHEDGARAFTEQLLREVIQPKLGERAARRVLASRPAGAKRGQPYSIASAAA